MIARGDLSQQGTIKKIKDEGIPVIIFGAGIVGEALSAACSRAGLDVECFCDNNIHKTKSLLCGIKVILPEDLKVKYKDANFLISAADIKDAVSQLYALGYRKWHTSGFLLRDLDLARLKFSAPLDFVEYAVGTCLLCHDSYLSPDKIFLRSVDIIITERCSLKCRDCSNLMQYYKLPVDGDIDELMCSMNAFFDIIDQVNEFRVIGGEPFMHKEFQMIIRGLDAQPKVKKIVIYTNGTILPHRESIEYLRSDKVLVIITDYGSLSKKADALVRALGKNNIAYYAQKAKGWSDCSGIARHNRSLQEQKEVFRRCCAKNTFTLSNGKLYHCPFSANVSRLRAVPDYANDFVDILWFQQAPEGIHEKKESLKAFILEKEYLKICDYCNGRPFGAPEITPAIQTDKPLEYEKYN